LPDIDGMSVLKALKSDPATRGLTIVALSANAGADEVRAARDSGALDYWTKPIAFDAFIRGMRMLLRKPSN
jgi:CheY-like chemotaxis protein